MPTKKQIEKVEKFIKNASANPAKVERATARYEEARGRREKETELWHHWDQNGRQQQHLEPLLKSIEPLIRSEKNKRMQGVGGSIPSTAMMNELRNTAVRAIETYSPTKGKLTTHIGNNFMRVTDFVSNNRNSKYMPRAYVEQWGAFRNAKLEFQEEHGREPSLHELKTKLPTWSDKQIKRMHKGFGDEAFTEMGVDLRHDVQIEDPMQRVRGALLLMKSQLTPEQQTFANMHYPVEGTEQMSVAAIAKAMNMPAHKAYRVKKKIEAKLAPIVRKQ